MARRPSFFRGWSQVYWETRAWHEQQCVSFGDSGMQRLVPKTLLGTHFWMKRLLGAVRPSAGLSLPPSVWGSQADGLRMGSLSSCSRCSEPWAHTCPPILPEGLTLTIATASTASVMGISGVQSPWTRPLWGHQLQRPGHHHVFLYLGHLYWWWEKTR